MNTNGPNYTTFLQHLDEVTRSVVRDVPVERALYLMLVEHSARIRPLFERSATQSLFYRAFNTDNVVPKYDMVIWYLLQASTLVWGSMAAAGLHSPPNVRSRTSMQIYLVGGAVRDTLMGCVPKDRDYVVVGSTPEQMLAVGYHQVGADFPVFLKDGEEYALARTERKSGSGYHGFEVIADETVTLEDDLLRRDFTMNAMALDGMTVIDPYNGRADIEAGLIRHVSDAFREDPVRVLRAARFAARFADRGFKVAPETMQLMTEMVEAGELAHLTAERVWKELSNALLSQKPSVFLQVLRECGALKVVLPEIDELYGVPQNEKYHPEVDTGIHTEMVIDVARSETDNMNVLFAALCHDLGKALTPHDEWPAHRGHENRGIEPVETLCDRLKVPTIARRIAVMACREHLNVHRIDELQPKTLHDLIVRCGGMQGAGAEIVELAMVCEADKRGRLGLFDTDYPQGKKLIRALHAMRSVKFADLPTVRGDGQPFVRDGERIAKDLRNMRIAAIKAWLEPTLVPAPKP